MDLISLLDWNEQQITDVIALAEKVKKSPPKYADAMKNKTLAMIFQKASTRTRLSFEAGTTQLGGHAIFLDYKTTQLQRGASLSDEMKCVERYVDIIMARVFKHEDIVAIADAVEIPVINGLCNLYHPCQILGDLLTIKEKKGKLEGLTLAFVGDGNNVCNTLIIGCSKAGMKINVATPKGYEPHETAVEVGKKYKSLTLTNDPAEAVKGADIVYTDAWVSMGNEAEEAARLNALKPYQVNEKLLAGSRALVMHCLPAHRGQELTDAVMDGKNSIVFDQAENRMHIQKAIMLKLLGKAK